MLMNPRHKHAETISTVKVDKNSLWCGLNIKKSQLCVKAISAQDPGSVWGLLG